MTELEEKAKNIDGKTILNPFVVERDRPTIYYEKQKATTTDKKAVVIRVSGEDSKKTFNLFQKVKKEMKV